MQESISCQQFEEQIFAYIDGMLTAAESARFLAHAQSCPECMAALREAEAFEAGMHEMLAPIAPPADFAQRVMSALPEPKTTAKIVKFPRRSVVATIGTVAAAAVIALAVNVGSDLDNDAPLTPPQVADDPVISIPVEPTEPGELTPDEPTLTDDEQGSVQVADEGQNVVDDTRSESGDAGANQEQNSNNADNNVNNDVNDKNDVTISEIKLPQASYGDSSEGFLSRRLVADLEGTDIYSPSLSTDGKYVTFYTQDENYTYLWRGNLQTPAEPEMIDYCAVSGDNLTGTANQTTNLTAVFSPDNSMLASNTNQGIWCSVLGEGGEMWQLTPNGGGSLLTWSYDSSKFLFTDAEGGLYIGYPMEKQVVEICSQPVSDFCWGRDNSTVVYTMEENGVLKLYSVQVP